MLILDLVPHLDAGDRGQWVGDQDLRPLSSLGWRQADILAEALLAEPLDALYSSPALRCRQTLEIVAERRRLPVTVLDALKETYAFLEPARWTSGVFAPVGPSLGGAFAAGRGWSAIQQIQAELPAGRAIACSHGDLVPAVAAFIDAAFGGAPPAPLQQRGQWYRVTLSSGRAAVVLCQASRDFPLA